MPHVIVPVEGPPPGDYRITIAPAAIHRLAGGPALMGFLWTLTAGAGEDARELVSSFTLKRNRAVSESIEAMRAYDYARANGHPAPSYRGAK